MGGKELRAIFGKKFGFIKISLLNISVNSTN
jgi:hypothetical protein